MRAIPSALAVAVATLGFVGCDASKDELEKTKMNLTAVTTERDSLKTQLAAAQQQVTTLQSQVTDLTAKAAAAAAVAPTAAAPTTAVVAEREHHAEHHATAAAPKHETAAGKAVEVKETKGGSSNRE